MKTLTAPMKKHLKLTDEQLLAAHAESLHSIGAMQEYLPVLEAAVAAGTKGSNSITGQLSQIGIEQRNLASIELAMAERELACPLDEEEAELAPVAEEVHLSTQARELVLEDTKGIVAMLEELRCATSRAEMEMQRIAYSAEGTKAEYLEAQAVYNRLAHSHKYLKVVCSACSDFIAWTR